MSKSASPSKLRIALVTVAFLAALALTASTAFTWAEPAWAASDAPSVSVTRAATGKLVMKKGSSYKLAAKASAGKLTYKSSKKKVVSVTKKGVLKAKKTGKATITVTAKKGSKKAVTKVKVAVVKASKFKKVKKLAAKVSRTELQVGKIAKIKVSFAPKKASNKNVIFESSAPAVASVSDTGVVTARSAGTAKITVTSCDNAKAKTSVTVKVAECVQVSLGTLQSDISGAQVGVSETAVFTMSVKGSTKTPIVLYRDSTPIAKMNDDGVGGDAVASDGNYSASVECSSSSEAVETFRAECGNVKSNEVTIRYFGDLEQTDFEDYFANAAAIEEIERRYEADGFVREEDVQAALDEVNALAKGWVEDGKVLSIERSEGSLAIQFASGIWYLYAPSRAGLDSTGSEARSTVSTFQPFKDWYRVNSDPELDDAATDGAAMNVVGRFTNFSFTKNFDNEDVSLDAVRSIGANEVVLWHGHGGYIPSKGSVVFTGERLDGVAFLADPVHFILNIRYAEDFLSGRIVVCANQLAITPAFIAKHLGNIENTFIYLGACESGKDSRLADSFLGHGAAVVVGNDKEIETDYNCRMMRDVIDGMLLKDEAGKGCKSVKQALAYAKGLNGQSDDNGAKPLMFGDGSYRLSHSGSNIDNEGYEDPEAHGDDIAGGTFGTCKWRINSDGRLIVGAGELPSHNETSSFSWPWSSFSGQIKEAKFNAGVTLAGSALAMFMDCTSLENVDGLSNWDTSQVTDMKYMFYGCKSLVKVGGLASWDVSSVGSMNYMFYDCSSLGDIEGLASWDTSSLMTTVCMFDGCKSLRNVYGLTNWRTSEFRNVWSMFHNCSSLENIFGLTSWDTSAVWCMNGMFAGCSSLTSVDSLSNWDTSNVTMMGHMFEGCSSLVSADALEGWSISDTTDMDGIFDGCTELKTLPSWYKE